MKYEITSKMMYGGRSESEILADLSKPYEIVGFRPPAPGDIFVISGPSGGVCECDGSYPKYQPRLILTLRKVRKYVFTEMVPQPSKIREGDFYMFLNFRNWTQTIYCASTDFPRSDYIVLTREVVEE